MDVEKEVDLYIKRVQADKEECQGENNYITACVKSALKAYKSLCEDGHSGMSWSIMKQFLNRMLEDLPLNAITEEDTFHKICHDSTIESCDRYSAFSRVKQDGGTYVYSDLNRCSTTTGWGCGFATRVIDKMFPITLPYYPSLKKYIVEAEDFATTGEMGCFDTQCVKRIKTPKGEIIDVYKYQKETEDGWVDITKEEYDQRKQEFLNNATAYDKNLMQEEWSKTF